MSMGVMGAAFAASTSDTLHVACEASFPPFEFYNKDTKQIEGFEIDLIKEMGKLIGKKVEVRNMAFDAIIPGVLTGQIDVGASGFSITPERAKRVMFTAPFYRSGLTILIPKSEEGKIKSFDDLKNKRISVQISTTSMMYAKKIPGAKVSAFNNAGDAILNVITGNADAVINDKPVTDYILAKNANLKAKTIHLPVMATADQFAMITSKSNAELNKELSQALQTLIDNGTFNKLHEKWFGIPAPKDL